MFKNLFALTSPSPVQSLTGHCTWRCYICMFTLSYCTYQPLFDMFIGVPLLWHWLSTRAAISMMGCFKQCKSLVCPPSDFITGRRAQLISSLIAQEDSNIQHCRIAYISRPINQTWPPSTFSNPPQLLSKTLATKTMSRGFLLPLIAHIHLPGTYLLLSPSLST